MSYAVTTLLLFPLRGSHVFSRSPVRDSSPLPREHRTECCCGCSSAGIVSLIKRISWRRPAQNGKRRWEETRECRDAVTANSLSLSHSLFSTAKASRNPSCSLGSRTKRRKRVFDVLWHMFPYLRKFTNVCVCVRMVRVYARVITRFIHPDVTRNTLECTRTRVDERTATTITKVGAATCFSPWQSTRKQLFFPSENERKHPTWCERSSTQGDGQTF